MSELLIIRDLSDEEIKNLTDDEVYELGKAYEKEGMPLRATVKGLLMEYDIKYDDLTDFILGMSVGVCNYATRGKEKINITRKNSSLKDAIVINLTDKYDAPDVVVRLQINENFIHEEAYTKDGLLLYQA